MAITTVLFDLDGTLLPMDQEVFAKTYISGLCRAAQPCGYEPASLGKTIWAGTAAMVKNNGRMLNRDAFWSQFAGVYGQEALADMAMFDDFYQNEFQQIQQFCGFQPQAAELIGWLKKKGIRVILATNPLFPTVATESRVRWAGMQPEDFSYITTFDNSHYCKPNPDYYREILEKTGIMPEECLMVGNDADEDMVAQTLGMQVFLLTDCLINAKGQDIEQYPHGNFSAMTRYVQAIVEEPKEKI